MLECAVHEELVRLARSLPALKEPSLVSSESYLRALEVVASHLKVSTTEASQLVQTLHMEADISVTYENVLNVASLNLTTDSEEASKDMKRAANHKVRKLSMPREAVIARSHAKKHT